MLMEVDVVEVGTQLQSSIFSSDEVNESRWERERYAVLLSTEDCWWRGLGYPGLTFGSARL